MVDSPWNVSWPYDDTAVVPQVSSATASAGFTLSVWTMYGGKLTLYLAMSTKLAKIHGRPGWSGRLDDGGLMKTVAGRKIICSVAEEPPGSSRMTVLVGARKSAAPWAANGVDETPDADGRVNVISNELVSELVAATARVSAARAPAVGGEVCGGSVDEVLCGLVEPHAEIGRASWRERV